MFSSSASQVSSDANFIEDVFQTWLYTGNGSTQTIANGIDLAGKGGLVWFKGRTGTINHSLYDTARGREWSLATNVTTQQEGPSSSTQDLTSFNSNGFSLGTPYWSPANNNGVSSVSWTFREQAKFFDVVTYTGNGGTLAVNHSLGSSPGAVFIKRTNASSDWVTGFATSNGASNWASVTGRLNTSAAFVVNGEFSTWSSTAVTVVNSGAGYGDVNTNGATYVMYVFAHNAGGFGLTGTDNVISCGSYTGNGTAGNAVTLGYEPQFVMIKRADATGNWFMQDVMRGIPNSGSSYYLYANTSDAEVDGGAPTVIPTATGFTLPSFSGWNASGGTFIYIAIRRGPMKVPTTGTSVFSPVSTSGNVTSITSGFPVDFALGKEIKNSTSYGNYAIDRLRGGAVLLETNTTGAEYTSQTFKFDSNTQFLQSGGGLFYGPSIYWLMRRAPGFFDEVCYTGTGGTGVRTVDHGLTVAPELLIIKERAVGGSDWVVGSSGAGWTKFGALNTTGSFTTSNVFGDTAPTPTVFSIRAASGSVNETGRNFVAYLFASAPGVSKVGSYTGNGSNQTINCGFTGGARFVMIKRTDSTGDWYVWDTARGIVSGNDPRLSLNTTAAEVTTDDSVDTDSTGFVVNQLSATNINVTSATYIFLSIS